VVEIEHYDRKARSSRAVIRSERAGQAWLGVPEAGPPKASDRFLEATLRRLVPGKRVLDYGCGMGGFSLALARLGAREVVGIDLSRESLAVAEERLQAEPDLAGRVQFRQMDAEALEFAPGEFDLVFDRGTFSSIDFRTGLAEVQRVLRYGGCLVGVETLGHHPLANLNRRLRRWRGTRTAWAAAHILRMADLEEARRQFAEVETRFFHLVSLLAFPFLELPGGRLVAGALDGVDRGLFALWPLLQRFGFKVVFVMRKAEREAPRA
jgi:ubiquinone/menaquinone biosynthesis C-methylase UbiE